jgi:hypothetical protein
MSTFLSAYTISMFDPVETGRTKINYLLTGDTSPFAIFSGTPDWLPYLSVYRINNYTPNYIEFSQNSYSANSPFNLIINGFGNLINTEAAAFPDGGFNFVSGAYNKIQTSLGAPTKAKHNTIIGSSNTNYAGDYSFIHGASNLQKYSFVNTIISSQSSNLNHTYRNTFLSSQNSEDTISSYNSYYSFKSKFNFISGDKNKITDSSGIGFGISYSFIGNGYNNVITTTNGAAYGTQRSIINGQNNTILANAGVNYAINIFGSNMTSVAQNNSHFENLYVDETLMATNSLIYVLNDATSTLTLTDDYTFNEIILNYTTPHHVKVDLPTNPDVDLMFLSTTFILSGGANWSVIYFSNSSISFADKLTFTPSNLSAKPGNFSSGYASFGNIGNSFAHQISASTPVVSYFFLWTDILNKWVMYSSDNEKNVLDPLVDPQLTLHTF